MTISQKRSGPLDGVRVVEFAGLGPVPFAAMILSDMGADVVRIERPDAQVRPHDIVLRGRSIVKLDLKSTSDVEAAASLAARAEILLEGFRPGVMERLGLGPTPLIAANPRLVYGRMTGWGQDGPLAQAPGHDINFIAKTGALDAIGPADGAPVIPLNLVGDYGGGAMYLVSGVLAALVEARSSGRGQVVDCAASEGVLSMMTQFHGMVARKEWGGRGVSQFGGGAHFYGTYACADGKYIAVSLGEAKFYAAFRRCVGLDDPIFDRLRDRSLWPRLKQRIATAIATKSRDAWMAIFADVDVCVTPVQSIDDALDDPDLRARGAIVEVDGVKQAAPTPRFSRTPGAIQSSRTGVEVADILARWAGALAE